MRTHATAIGLVLLVAVACDGDREARPASVGKRLTGVPIDSVIDDLDAEHAEVIRLALKEVPDPLPRHAVSLVKLISDATPSPEGVVVATPPDGMLRTHVILADPGSNSVRIHLLCLRNAEQVPCAPTALIWDVALGPSTLARAAVAFPVAEGDRLDFIALVDGDLSRPRPASTGLSAVVGGRRTNDPAVVTAPAHAAVFGGCDFATIATDTSPQSSFRPPGTQPRSQPLFLVIQPCEGTTEILRAVQVLGSDIARPLEGWDGFKKVTQPALVVPLSTSGFGRGLEMRVVVLRDRAAAWITHPVRLQ